MDYWRAFSYRGYRILIWCFVAGPCKSKGDKGCDPPCSGKQTCKNGECVGGDWSDAQIAKAVSELPNSDEMPGIATCMMKAVSQTISYQDYMKMTPTEQQAYMATNKDKLSPCLGKQGAWAPELFNEFVSALIIEKKLSPKCVQCTVNMLQHKYDPTVFTYMAGDDISAAIALAENTCVLSKGCP